MDDSIAAGTLAESGLPPEIHAEMERMNAEAAPLHIWLRTRANAPAQRAWHEGADEPIPQAPPLGRRVVGSATPKAVPHIWKWREISPYLARIAEIAPLEFTDRQQFLLTNPGFGGALRVTSTIRVAVSIYKSGDVAEEHLHTPNASRTILSDTGGYSLVDGEYCDARRGDLILTPAGTWHGHGNDDGEPVMWMDVLDWPLLEYLDAIWIRFDKPETPRGNKAEGLSGRAYGAGGLMPRTIPPWRGDDRGASPMVHFRGADLFRMLDGLRDQEGSPYHGVRVEYVNPATGGPVFRTLSYDAMLLRPGETLRPWRHSASTLYCVLKGSGRTEVNGMALDWEENDIFVVPPAMWQTHSAWKGGDAVLQAISDRPLLHAIGHYRAQGRDGKGGLAEIEM